jgi:hypothetical protein
MIVFYKTFNTVKRRIWILVVWFVAQLVSRCFQNCNSGNGFKPCQPQKMLLRQHFGSVWLGYLEPTKLNRITFPAAFGPTWALWMKTLEIRRCDGEQQPD